MRTWTRAWSIGPAQLEPPESTAQFDSQKFVTYFT